MNVFPLIRTKWSNEHIMAALFLVLVLYHLPVFSKDAAETASFIIITAAGLILDALMNFIRYKRLWCSVSAAVTAAIISVLTYDVPLWERLLGMAAALVLGKHIFGGTGKNLLNPAMTGMLLIFMLYQVPYPFFAASYLLLPAVILSLPFLLVRPFAGIGYLAGTAAALIINGNLTLMEMLAYGAFFFAFVVMTDPVTITMRPVPGTLIGLAAGLSVLFTDKAPVIMIIGILGANLVSYMVEEKTLKAGKHMSLRRVMIKVVPKDNIQFTDLTDAAEGDIAKTSDIPEGINADIILNRIRDNEVFGMGGAAFPTYRKLMAVRAYKGSEKHLIINGVECDPGLIHDRWLLRNRTGQILEGIELLLKCTDFSSVQLAAKDISGLDYPDNIKIHKVPDYYPAGAEKLLIAEVLGVKLDNKQIPAENGILVLNAQTLLSVYEAVILNKKADTRYLTAADLKNGRAQVVRVKLGMRIEDALEAVFPGAVTVFAGGGLMQSYMADEEAIVDRKVNFIASARYPRYKESPQCSKCGSCSSGCPAGLKVNKIADLVDAGRGADALRYHPEECISCGSCSYSCLAGRNLAARVKTAKEAAC